MDEALKLIDEDGIEHDDLLNSADIIKKIHSMVMGSEYSVYAISGAWGTGKTCFIKMWENILYAEGQIFVHIDAFKMDYEVEPFIMLIKALNDAIKKMDIKDHNKIKDFKDKAKKIFSLKNMAQLAVNVLVEKTIGKEPVKEFVNNAFNTYFDEVTTEGPMYDELVSLMVKITDEFSKTVHIIIDELDRCRPDFALETLERIKHIFNLKKVKFILVYNEEVLKSMIKRRYGDIVNAERYLNKFVQVVYILDNTKRLKAWYANELKKVSENFGDKYMLEYLGECFNIILSMKEIYKLGFRDIQRLLSNLTQHSCSSPEYFVIIASVEVLKYVDIDEYNTMVNYCNVHGHFASNAPEVRTYRDIIRHFIAPNHPITFDEAFYKYYDEFLKTSYISKTSQQQQ